MTVYFARKSLDGDDVQKIVNQISGREEHRATLLAAFDAQVALNEELEIRIAELETALAELADDLAAEIDARYDPLMQGAIHPAMLSRYDCDMASVRRARALLAKEA